MPKFLKQKCIFVKGAKNAAIYDLVEKKVYALNDAGKSIMEKFLVDPCCLNPTEIEYINKLGQLGLIERNDLPVYENEKDIFQVDCKLGYVWLELTQKCNLRCVHCYGQFGCTIADSSEEMSKESWKRVICEIKAAGCVKIQFIGGEPLCSPDFQEILTYAYNVGIENIDIFTNGTLIDEHYINLIKHTGANVRLSLYGHNAQIHDSITRVKGSFRKTESALKLLKKHDIPTKIAVVIMKANQFYIDEIKAYIEFIGHEYSGYDIIRPVAEKVQDNCVTDIEILKPRYRIMADFSIDEKKYSRNLHWNSCWSGKLAIASNGDVMPCIFARDMVIENVNENSLSTAVNKAGHHWSVTKDQVEGCRDCEYRYACHDCRPLALSLGGSISSKEPRCCYDPYEGSWHDVQECTMELGINYP